MGSNVNELTSFADLTSLATEKVQPSRTVLTSIISPSVARDTYSQIIDGMSSTNSIYRAINISEISTNANGDEAKPSDSFFASLRTGQDKVNTPGIETRRTGRNPFLLRDHKSASILAGPVLSTLAVKQPRARVASLRK